MSAPRRVYPPRTIAPWQAAQDVISAELDLVSVRRDAAEGQKFSAVSCQPIAEALVAAERVLASRQQTLATVAGEQAATVLAERRAFLASR